MAFAIGTPRPSPPGFELMRGVFIPASMSSLTATLLGKLTDLGFYQQEPWVIAGAPAALIGVTLLFAFLFWGLAALAALRVARAVR